MEIPWPIEKGMESAAQKMDGRVLAIVEEGKSNRVVELVDGEESLEKEQDSKVAMRWKMLGPNTMSVIVNDENMRRMAKINFFDKNGLLYFWHLSSEFNSPQISSECPEAIGTIAFLLHKFKHGKFQHLGTIRQSGTIASSKVDLPDYNVAIFSAPYRLPNEAMIFNMCLGVLHVSSAVDLMQKKEGEAMTLEDSDIHALFIAHRCWHCKKPCNKVCKTCHMAIFCSDSCHDFAQDIHSQICKFPHLTLKQQQRFNSKWNWIS